MNKEWYEVVVWTQVLRSGTWDGGDWEWVSSRTKFSSSHYDFAKKLFDSIQISNDIPIVELTKEEEIWEDGVCYDSNTVRLEIKD